MYICWPAGLALFHDLCPAARCLSEARLPNNIFYYGIIQSI